MVDFIGKISLIVLDEWMARNVETSEQGKGWDTAICIENGNQAIGDFIRRANTAIR